MNLNRLCKVSGHQTIIIHLIARNLETNLQKSIYTVCTHVTAGPCEEEFPTLPQLDCAIVNSAINVSFIPNTFMRVNEDYLKDATIAEVGRLFEDINDDNGGEMVLRLRSPIGVSTVLNFYFHNLNTPMGPVEMDIVKRSFFSVFESPLGLSDPSFTLTDVDVVLNAVLEERINTRRLHIRTNSDHTHASLRVDLFVQATCQGLLCDHGNFHSSLSDMVDDSRKKFVDTMKLKGHFTVQNDYFETLTFIKPFEHNFPGIPDDDNIFTFPSRSDGYEMPWWFWLSLVLVLAPITGFAVIVVLNARLYRRKNKFGYGKTPQKGNLFSPARKQTDCCRIIMDPGTEDKESPRNKSNGRAAVVKSPSSLCKKQQISTIAPISPTEAKYMFQKSPAKPCSPILEASSDSQTTSITGRSPKKSSSLALSSHRSLHSFSTSPPKSSPSKGTPIVVEEPPNQ